MKRIEQALAGNIGNRLTHELAVGLLVVLKEELAKVQAPQQPSGAPAATAEGAVNAR